MLLQQNPFDYSRHKVIFPERKQNISGRTHQQITPFHSRMEKTTSIRCVAIRETRVSWHPGGPIQDTSQNLQDYHSTIVLKGSRMILNLAPIMLRDATIVSWIADLIFSNLDSARKGQRFFSSGSFVFYLFVTTNKSYGNICI